MKVRDAKYSDAFDVASVLAKAAKGKSNDRMCLDRARQAIRLGQQNRKSRKRVALVAKKGKVTVGFLFATEVHAFDLLESVLIMEVHFLVGEGLALMLRRLRNLTKKRIWMAVWSVTGHKVEFWERFFKRQKLSHYKVGHVYQL